jgi:hypothetical protein
LFELKIVEVKSVDLIDDMEYGLCGIFIQKNKKASHFFEFKNENLVIFEFKNQELGHFWVENSRI